MSGSNDAKAGASRIRAEEQLAWILERVAPLAGSSLPLAEAFGRTLTHEIRSRYDLPLWNNSAMDGYALRSADIVAAAPDRPVELAVAGEVLAGGSGNPGVAPGTAVRIMTGAPVPDDADAVLPVELTASDDAGSAWASRRVGVLGPVPRGANIRLRGEDTPAGAIIAHRGDALTAARISALAAAGVPEVRVSGRPRVAVIATGAELRDPGAPLERGQIPESNSLLIAGLLRECGLEPVAIRRCTDDPESVIALLSELSPSCDAIISTGGIGPGSHDVMRIALEHEPGIRATRVAIRPGQLQCAGPLRAGPLMFALPGNPVSAAVSFELFVRPALLAMQGRSEVERRRLGATAEVGWRGAAGRLQVLPIVFSQGPDGALRCRPAVNPRGVSHAVGGHGAAQGYALIGAERGDVATGEVVEVIGTGS